MLLLGAGSSLAQELKRQLSGGYDFMEVSRSLPESRYGDWTCDPSTAQATVEDVVKKHGLPDYAVYFPGTGKGGNTHETTDEDFYDAFNVNVGGFLGACRHLLPLMRAAREEDGRDRAVVAVSSEAAWSPVRKSALYSSSKAALNALVASLEQEYFPVRMEAYSPGLFESKMLDRMIESLCRKKRISTEKARSLVYSKGVMPLSQAARELADLVEGRATLVQVNRPQAYYWRTRG